MAPIYCMHICIRYHIMFLLIGLRKQGRKYGPYYSEGETEMKLDRAKD